jgi:uncharacterized membrane protein YccC
MAALHLLRLEPREVDRATLARAARTAIALPLTFAAALVVFDDRNGALFASFGTFGMLALADFGGEVRDRALAYLGLTATGAVLIAVGTPMSQNAWLAALSMAVVGFVVAFSGALGGYIAAGAGAVTIAFVLAVAIPADPHEIGVRALGWTLAGGSSMVAALFLWRQHEDHDLLEQAAATASALGDLVVAVASPHATAAPHDLRGRVTSEMVALETAAMQVPVRPIGPTARVQALACVVEQLRSVQEFAEHAMARVEAAAPLPPADRELLLATARLLRGFPHVDGASLTQLEAARRAHRRAIEAHVPAALARHAAPQTIARDLDRGFRVRTLSLAALSAGANTVLAAGGTLPDEHWEVPPLVPPVELAAPATRWTTLLRSQLRRDSVWLQTATRAGLALGLAVLVAGLASLSHAFWVALATLSVLKSNSVGTRKTAWQFFLGTVVGFGLASALVVTIGDHRGLLWIVLPVTTFAAVYTPTSALFVVAQAMFTVMVVVLLNLIEPEGWQVGLVRVLDIGVGVTTAVVVGALLWPRGAAGALRASISSLLECGARYLRRAIDAATGRDRAVAVAELGVEVRTASVRASDAFASYIDERGSNRVPPRVWATLVTAGESLQFGGDALLASTRARDALPLTSEARARVSAAAGELERSVRTAAESLTGGPNDHTDEITRAVDDDLTEVVDDALARLDGHAPAEDVDNTLRVAWIVDWIATMQRMLQRIEQPLASARTPARQRWWQ